MPLKADAEEIRAHMRGLALSLGLDENRKWWPKWLFRSDHVENTAAILNSGKLLSRASAESGALIVKDSGSPRIISELDPEEKSYVRLYFRPRTPTKYSNEGIRPQSEIRYEAHMPVPTYLLFSSDLLMENGVYFTRGRFTQNSDKDETARHLKEMEFQKIYHDKHVGPLGDQRRSEILNARHSEVLVKNELTLHYMKHIVSRSIPERDTLMNLLKPEIKSKWLERFHVDRGDRRCFYRLGTFIESVQLSSAESQFKFYSNNELHMRGPFCLEIKWNFNGQQAVHRNDEFYVSTRPRKFDLSGLNFDTKKYRVTVTLNGDLAYFGKFNGELEHQFILR